MERVNAEAADIPGTWMCSGKEVFPSMLAAMEEATRSICLETYIYTGGTLGKRFLEALVRAAKRGVVVRVMVDALGSMSLPATFWKPLREAGGEVRQFNPLSLHRLGIRDHRKLLVCDSRVVYVGGFNIADEYDGDGITSGWFDLGLRLEGRMARELEGSFEELFAKADFQHKRFMRLRRSSAKRAVFATNEQLLLSGPGRGHSPIKRSLTKDLATAREVRIIMAYFLPTWRIRRDLARVVRRGGTVDLILAGKSDVMVSQLAAQSLYRRILRVGMSIFEYEPQILHAKLIIIDDIVYVGSANLDQRSLQINYELMIRFQDRVVAEQARTVFEGVRRNCRQITKERWRAAQSLWRSIKQRWAYLLLVRIDPYIARRQWRSLPD
jgi:cardiolipin synthase A/B